MHKHTPILRSTGAAGCGPWTCRRLSAVLAAGCLLLGACHKTTGSAGEAPPASDAKAAENAKSQPAAKNDADAKEDAAEGVTLTPEQAGKLGIATQPAQALDYSEEAAGFGVVVNHESIAQAVAELATAKATERLSRSSLSRAHKLDGTPGAVSADVEEAAAQKAEVDAAALTLTNRRLSSALGMNPPWKNGGKDAILPDLAAGKIKLVRVTFPLGALSGGTPARLRAAHIGAKPGTGWKMNVVWDAPADATVPGRSFFALLKGSDAGEGERLQVWAPIGESLAGVVIPAAAAVMSEGKYWCYVEKKPGAFARVELDTSRPTPDGYFVTEGVGAGDKVVTAAAGQLLAKESGSAAEPD
ncbi:MAG: efflux RND transporter periplasmic adaptor subunit [Steroidobacteraceae bacterium]